MSVPFCVRMQERPPRQAQGGATTRQEDQMATQQTRRHPMERRHILWLVVGSLMLALILQPSGAGAQSPRSPQHGVYLALGDSLASGVGATDPLQLGYVPR